MAEDINKKPYNDATQLKLDIFRDCFKEWFPVFVNHKWIKGVQVFDFFAGSGKDIKGNSGSPLVLLEEAKGSNRSFCSKVNKPVKFIFNEARKQKSIELDSNVNEYINNCENINNCGGCIYEKEVKQLEFKELFKEQTIINILKDKNIAKFLLLDQYGFSQIDDKIFKQLISFPKTDFVFFITSSFIKRFHSHPYVKTYLDTEKINFDESRPNECHRIIAKYFRNIVPSSQEYYLHHFSIRKDEKKGNYYGLIFGSNHTLGMEKFVKVCWQKDRFSGESNFNIDNDYEIGTLFYNSDSSNKREIVSKDLKELVLSAKFSNNIEGLKYTLKKGCEPSLFISVIKELEIQKKVKRTGDLNYSATNIHKVKTFGIEVLN